MATFRTYNPKETEELAFSFASIIPYGKVIAMFGDLGAGKTAFTRGFTKGLGINCDVSSPTFALVNEYRGERKTVYHFDMYRISGWDDLYSTGYFDYLDEGATLIIEWSENIEAVLPDDCVRITINKTDDENERIIEVSGVENIENSLN